MAVEELRDDCDGDALLLRVRPNGPACHTGSLSCFAPALWRTISERAAHAARGLVHDEAAERGHAACARKVGEEAVEVVTAALVETDERLVSESADLVYHLYVLLASRGVDLAAVEDELARASALAVSVARPVITPRLAPSSTSSSRTSTGAVDVGRRPAGRPGVRTDRRRIETSGDSSRSSGLANLVRLLRAHASRSNATSAPGVGDRRHARDPSLRTSPDFAGHGGISPSGRRANAPISRAAARAAPSARAAGSRPRPTPPTSGRRAPRA